MNLNQKSERDPHPNKSSHLNWEMFAIWSVVVASFVALFVAGYVIWVKCHGGCIPEAFQAGDNEPNQPIKK